MRDARSVDAHSSPAADLADVWDVLDSLASAKPATDLTATTVELVAAKVANTVRPKTTAATHWTDRVVPLTIIIGGLFVGLVMGRIAAPDPDARILERLPVIEHLDLLQELGSVEFLEALANQVKDGQVNPPRWLRFVRDPSVLREEANEFETAIAALRSEMNEKDSSGDILERRREKVGDLNASDFAKLEKSAAAFEDLNAVDRRELERVAAVLADASPGSLHEAAKKWHVIISAMSPERRHDIIEMSKDDRLEWLARWAPWQPIRPSEDGRTGERRPPPPRRDGPDDRPRPGNWQPPFQRPPNGPANGEPEGPPPPKRPPLNGPPSSRPSPPREVPSETREAPR